jgi:hypothetical protein
MNWQDNDRSNRSVSDEGYVITWAHFPHGRWYKAWARRQERQRRGTYLGASYDRADLERACDRHRISRETFEAS